MARDEFVHPIEKVNILSGDTFVEMGIFAKYINMEEHRFLIKICPPLGEGECIRANVLYTGHVTVSRLIAVLAVGFNQVENYDSVVKWIIFLI